MPEQIKTDYFKLINDLKKDYEKRFFREPTHIIMSIDDFYEIENEMLERVTHIKDTTNGVLGTRILGMKVIRAINFPAIKVAHMI